MLAEANQNNPSYSSILNTQYNALCGKLRLLSGLDIASGTDLVNAVNASVLTEEQKSQVQMIVNERVEQFQMTASRGGAPTDHQWRVLQTFLHGHHYCTKELTIKET